MNPVVQRLLQQADAPWSRLCPAEVQVRVEVEEVSRSDWARLEQILHGADGWVCFTDAAVEIVEAHNWNRNILSAEAHIGQRSLSVRAGPDGWRLAWISEGEGVPCVAFDEELLSVEPGRSLRYRTYWSRPAKDPYAPWQPYVSAFRGWTPKPPRTKEER